MDFEYYIIYNKIIYEGQWENNKKDGYGILQYSNGNRYEGQFKNGMKDGQGIEYFFGGINYNGIFKRGKKVKAL